MSLRMLGIGAGVLAGGYLAGGSLGLVLALIFLAPIYYLSLVLHPNRNCWTCRGTGQLWGALFQYARRPCGRCAGTGTKPRLGRRLFFS